MSIKNIPPDPGYILRFKRGAVSFLGGMRRHILSYFHDNGSEIFFSPPISPWERLMGYGPVGYYYTAMSTAEGLMLQREEFISNLFQSSPRLSQYWATQSLVYEYCYQLFINFHDKLPSFVAPAFMMTTHPAPHHLCPAVTPLPPLPTIIITDVDGPQAGLYNALHETQDILRRGDGLLWREWTGKFSTARKTEDLFFDGAPPMPEDQEGEVHTEIGNPTAGTSLQSIPSGEANCPKQSLNDSQNPEWVWEEDKGSDQASTTNEENDFRKYNRAADIRSIQDNVPRELEWWERDDYPEVEEEEEEDGEGEDDEGDEGDEGDEEDEEYSEDDDGEHENDFDDDQFEEGSDVEGDSNENLIYGLCSITSHRVSVIETTVSLPYKSQPQHTIPVRAQAVVIRQYQIPQNLEHAEVRGAPLSSPSPSPSSLCSPIGDSDLESPNSSTTISSVPTPITPSSLSVTIDPPDLRKSHQRDSSESFETPWLLMNSLDVALRAARRDELELKSQEPPQ